MAPILVHITPVWSLLRMAAKASSCVPFSADTNFRGGTTCNLSNQNINFLFQNRRLTPFGARPLCRVRFQNPEAN
jgi:hypothetical protein